MLFPGKNLNQPTNRFFKEKRYFLKKYKPFDSGMGTTRFVTYGKQLYIFLRLSSFILFSYYAI